MKAARIDGHFNLEAFCTLYEQSTAWLLDAVVEGYGWRWQPFNWQLVPENG
jgi:phosphoribosylanthranilate isomerase